MREGPLYQQVRQFSQFTYSILAQAGFLNSRVQDLIGLRTLDERGAVAFESYDGDHCQFSDEWFAYMIRKYLLGDVERLSFWVMSDRHDKEGVPVGVPLTFNLCQNYCNRSSCWFSHISVGNFCSCTLCVFLEKASIKSFSQSFVCWYSINQ